MFALKALDMTQLLIVNQIWIDIKYDEILLNNTNLYLLV